MKKRIKKLPTFTNLNEYIDYQDGIIDYYDELIGLSSDDFGVNKKPHNRFFKGRWKCEIWYWCILWK